MLYTIKSFLMSLYLYQRTTNEAGQMYQKQWGSFISNYFVYCWRSKSDIHLIFFFIMISLNDFKGNLKKNVYMNMNKFTLKVFVP